MVSPFFWGRLEGAGTFSCSPLVSLFKGDAEGRGIGAGGAELKIRLSKNNLSDVLLNALIYDCLILSSTWQIWIVESINLYRFQQFFQFQTPKTSHQTGKPS